MSKDTPVELKIQEYITEVDILSEEYRGNQTANKFWVYGKIAELEIRIEELEKKQIDINHKFITKS